MRFYEFGKENKRVIFLLHGGGLSWWNFREEAELLKGEYHIVIPVLDGHADSDRPFTSIENNAKEIVDCINENYNGRVYLIGGLSLGAQILTEILSVKNDICDFAIVESCLAKPQNLISKIIAPSVKLSYGLINKMWFSKLQFRSLKINEDFFEDYYRDTRKISVDNMVSILKSNSEYELKSTLTGAAPKTLIVVGKREQRIMLESAEILHNTIADSMLLVLDDFYHGDLSINNPKMYIGYIKQLIGGDL